MPYTTQTAKNANQRRWRALDRARRAFAGICRDCPRPRQHRGDRQTVLCDVCAAKQQERRPEALQEFNEMKQLIRAQAAAHFHPLRDDRRQGGRIGAALAWALQMRNA